jgi:hypothetical protein
LVCVCVCVYVCVCTRARAQPGHPRLRVGSDFGSPHYQQQPGRTALHCDVSCVLALGLWCVAIGWVMCIWCARARVGWGQGLVCVRVCVWGGGWCHFCGSRLRGHAPVWAEAGGRGPHRPPQRDIAAPPSVQLDPAPLVASRVGVYARIDRRAARQLGFAVTRARTLMVVTGRVSAAAAAVAALLLLPDDW